eukprot:TRINITY_DN1572_c0_g1_i1.p1 TRINITY_DN1572_c0_g1~~TRINITY_DN1572_c0_g1_i1.p1  ORF type:complete len:236 (-),score=29.57 TRINITY_DN1572_c0_g1_i1:37-744(-)
MCIRDRVSTQSTGLQLEEKWEQNKKSSPIWLETLLKLGLMDIDALEHLLKYQMDFLSTQTHWSLLEDPQWVKLLQQCRFSVHQALMNAMPYHEGRLQRLMITHGIDRTKAALLFIYNNGWSNEFVQLMEEAPSDKSDESYCLAKISRWPLCDFALKHLLKYGINERTVEPVLSLPRKNRFKEHCFELRDDHEEWMCDIEGPTCQQRAYGRNARWECRKCDDFDVCAACFEYTFKL